MAVSDRQYASLKLLDRCRKLSTPITFITRLRLDAALYEPAPLRRPGQRGRPRLKGRQLPNLSVVAEDPATTWSPITVAEWYGGEERTIEMSSNTAIWYSTGLPAVPLRWVLIREFHEECSGPKRCYAPIFVAIRSRSFPGSSGGGGWKLPSRRCVGTSASRQGGSGRRWPYGGPHPFCWECFR